MVIRSKGLCPLCRSKELPAKPIYTKKSVKAGEKDNCLSAFFTAHILKLSSTCRSLEGTQISEPSGLNIAHLFPKSTHPSVKCHMENAIYLTWQEHSDFDNLLSKHEFTKLETKFSSWDVICQKFKAVLPYVSEQTSFKLAMEEYLNKRELIF